MACNQCLCLDFLKVFKSIEWFDSRYIAFKSSVGVSNNAKETDNGKSEIDRKMRKAAGDLYNRLGNIILKSMLRTLKENNEQRKKDNAEINTKITVDSMVYALNAVSRLFRTQGSAGTVNTAHALIGELSKQAKKDIARQKQDKGHEV